MRSEGNAKKTSPAYSSPLFVQLCCPFPELIFIFLCKYFERDAKESNYLYVPAYLDNEGKSVKRQMFKQKDN